MHDFIQDLRNKLQGPLPGRVAQEKMAPRPIDEERFDFAQRTDARLGAVLLLLYPDRGQIHFPLILRPVYKGAHSGQVALPGGKFEPGDKDLIYTALREAEEEVNIPAHKVETIGTLTEMYIVASNFRVLPVIGYVHEKPRFIPEIKEVADIIETPLDWLLDDSRVGEKNIVVADKYKIRSPYFDIHGHMVWGATAMMLNEFITLLKQ